VHKCYINPLNLFNQVGLIAINVLGQPLSGPGGPGGSVGGPVVLPAAGGAARGAVGGGVKPKYVSVAVSCSRCWLSCMFRGDMGCSRKQKFQCHRSPNQENPQSEFGCSVPCLASLSISRHPRAHARAHAPAPTLSHTGRRA
jgi:hypothetical protein